MKTYHIATIVKEEGDGGYTAYLPDFPAVQAWAKTVPEILDKADDLLLATIRSLVERGQSVPPPADLTAVKEKLAAIRAEQQRGMGEEIICQHIAAPEQSMMAVRLTISLPKGTLAEIDRAAKLAGMTRSGYIAAAALAYGK